MPLSWRDRSATSLTPAVWSTAEPCLLFLDRVEHSSACSPTEASSRPCYHAVSSPSRARRRQASPTSSCTDLPIDALTLSSHCTDSKNTHTCTRLPHTNAGMSLPRARTATMAETTLGPTTFRSSQAGRVSPNSTNRLAWPENIPSTCHLVKESQDALARAHLAATVACRSAVTTRPFSLTSDTSHIEE